MLVIKILLYILALFLWFKGANAPDENHQKIYFRLSYLTLFAYWVSLFTKINFSTLTLFFLSTWFYLYMGSESTFTDYRINWVRKFCFWATIISPIVSLLFCCSNLYDSDPKTIVTTINLVAVNQGFSVDGNISGSKLYVHGSVSGDSTYKYYYQDEDGGIHQGSIPTSSTTIYIIDDTQIPHLDINDTYVYMMDGNNEPATINQVIEYSVSYTLYIPEGSFAMNNYDVN